MRGNRNEKNLPDDKNDLLSLTTIWCVLGVTALHSGNLLWMLNSYNFNFED